MLPDHWTLVESEVDRLLDLSADEREDQLQKLPPELIEEVRSWLSSCDVAEGFLDGRPSVVGDPTMVALLAEQLGEGQLMPGERVGVYEIVRLAGKGGMGAVYLARRADGAFDKDVALKVVKRGMDTDQIIRRFRQERQILARLEHPNIARILDGGVTPEGLPYFVLEYVDGEPIDRYCDRNRLTIDQRLELFETVCQAVQYAHRNLVVHRDLKPGNILVTSEREVRLLDFGIAKVLTTGQADMTETISVDRRLTPAYAAPEQITGAPITTATDVYSLGMILYELLAGSRAYSFPTQRMVDIERVVCDEEPDRPSSRIGRSPTVEEIQVAEMRSIGPQSLRKMLRGDLDAVILGALRKNPEDRYDSAGELLNDLRAIRRGVPVTVRRETVSYRMSKFVRRHRTAVSLAAVIVLSLVLGVITTAWQARVASNQAQRNKTMFDFLVDLFDSVDPDSARGGVFNTNDIILAARDRIDDLDGQPDVQAAMLSIMGRLSFNLGSFDAAESLYAAASTGLREEYGPRHPEVAQAILGRARAVQYRRDFNRAEELFREALAVQQSAVGNADASTMPYLNGLASSLYTKGSLEDLEEAVNLYLESIEIGSREDPDGNAAVAGALDGLGSVYSALGQYDNAETYYRRALELLFRYSGPGSTRTADTMYGLAECLRRNGKLAESEEWHRKSLSIYETVHGPLHHDVAQGAYSLARVLHAQGRHADAESLYQKAATVWDEVLPGYIWSAYPRIRQGSLRVEDGEYESARIVLEAALAILPQDQHDRAAQLARAETGLLLGNALVGLGQRVNAETALQSVADVDACEPAFVQVRAAALTELEALYLADGNSVRAAVVNARRKESPICE